MSDAAMGNTAYRQRIEMVLYCGILVLGLARDVESRDVAATDIFEAWEQRREELKAFDVELECSLMVRPRTGHGTNLNSEFSMNLLVDGYAGRIRFETTSPHLTRDGANLSDVRRIVVSNGIDGARILTTSSSYAVSEGMINYERSNECLGNFNLEPIFLACNPEWVQFSPRMFTVDPSFSEDGYIQLVSSMPRTIIQLEENSFRVTKVISHDGRGALRTHLSIKYSDGLSPTWFPESWEATILDTDNGDIKEHYAVRVVRLIRDPTTSDSDFTLTFSEGTLVYHNSPRGGHFSLVNPDGTLTRVSNEHAAELLETGTSNIPTDDIRIGRMRAREHRSRSLILAINLFVLVSLIVAALYWRRGK